MTDENMTTPPRRRAVSRPAGPPSIEAVFQAPALPAAAGGVAAPAEASPPTAGAAKKARPSRARKAASTEPTAATEAAGAEPTPVEAAKKPQTARVRKAAATTVTFQAPDATAALKVERPRRLRSEDDGETTDADTSTDIADEAGSRSRRKRGGRRTTGRAERPASDEHSEQDANPEDQHSAQEELDQDDEGGSHRRRRRRRRNGQDDESTTDDPQNTVVRVRETRSQSGGELPESTRLKAKKNRRREGREQGRRRSSILTEAEFLARREDVNRAMVVRELNDRVQIAVLEDGVLVEHYVNRTSGSSMIGNVYLGKVQNVLPGMEAAFIDIGRGRNAVLYAGEVNWDAAGLEGQPKRIEFALKKDDTVLVQVTKDPVGHKGARLTSQVSLPGRYLVYVPDGSMTGISRKLPDTERSRLKRILRSVLPESAGVIVRTAAEGASEEDLTKDVARLQAQWEDIQAKVQGGNAPALLYAEPDLAIKVVRDIFNEDFTSLAVQGPDVYETLEQYISWVAPDLAGRLSKWVDTKDIFAAHRVDEQLSKALDRKVFLPSGGSLVIDRTEAMTVVDVNTGKFTGGDGTLEDTVTQNNLEAAEEIVRQLRLRDIGGIIVVDFIDMVLEANRDRVVRRLIECLGRDRTKHQVAEVSSLGLVQMTRKRIGQGLLETFSEPCDACAGRGVKVSLHTVHVPAESAEDDEGAPAHSEGSSRAPRGGAPRGKSLAKSGGKGGPRKR